MPKKTADYRAIRDGFSVRRHHTTNVVITPETVGHHTANVVAIIFFLCDDNPTVDIIRKALQHDVPEYALGDMPAPAKWNNPKLAKEYELAEAGVAAEAGLDARPMDPLAAAILKYADMMDLCFKAIEEVASGNEFFYPILARAINFAGNLLNGPLANVQRAHELMAIIIENPYVEIKVPQPETRQTRH